MSSANTGAWAGFGARRCPWRVCSRLRSASPTWAGTGCGLPIRPGTCSGASGGGGEFYFAHSFALRPAAGEDGVLAATTEYGGVSLVAAVIRETVFATQFHPEKSQVNGERLLAAFLDWKP